MGTVLASAILAKVDTVLLDTAKTRWPDAEKLVYLNDGQRQIVILKPDAYVVNDAYKLVAGTKQSVPDGTVSFTNPSAATLKEGIALIKVVRNMGTNGTTAGAIVSTIESEFLDAYNPDWHSDSQAAAVKNYVFDDKDPKRYYVTPPNTGTQYVEVVYSALPDDAATLATAITLADVYQNALRDYVLYRCFLKDAALSPFNAQRAQDYFNAFASGLGRMDMVVAQLSPNPKQTGGVQ